MFVKGLVPSGARHTVGLGAQEGAAQQLLLFLLLSGLVGGVVPSQSERLEEKGQSTGFRLRREKDLLVPRPVILNW